MCSWLAELLCVQRLTEKGADLESVNLEEQTALLVAAAKGNNDTVEVRHSAEWPRGIASAYVCILCRCWWRLVPTCKP